MPMLPVTRHSCSMILIGACKLAETRLAPFRLRPRRRNLASATRRTRRRRAGRRHRNRGCTACRRAATSLSSRSPASCPSESLTILKRSRSMNRTAHGRSWRFAASIACCKQLAEQRSIRQPGQLVVCREILDLVLGRFADGDVLDDRDVVQQRAVARAPRRGRDADPDRRAVLADVALFDRQRIDDCLRACANDRGP